MFNAGLYYYVFHIYMGGCELILFPFSYIARFHDIPSTVNCFLLYDSDNVFDFVLCHQSQKFLPLQEDQNDNFRCIKLSRKIYLR